MNLEIKHLSPYLPYQLMVENLNFSGIKHSELTNLYCLISKENTHLWQYKTDVGNTAPVEKCKPILKPLNAIYNENIHKDSDISYYRWLYENTDCEAEQYFLETIEFQTNRISEIINYTPYSIMQKLFEWHFDVFGLIENGLAIDYYSIHKA